MPMMVPLPNNSSPASCVLSQLFLKQVAGRPHATALKTSSEEVTFSQLCSRAGEIGDALTKAGAAVEGEKRTGRRQIVAVFCGDSQIAEICAILGVVLAGGCFVPIDEALPVPRLREVVKDAQPDAIVLSRALLSDRSARGSSAVAAIVEEASRWQGFPVLYLEENGQPSKPRESQAAQRGRATHREGAVSEDSTLTHRPAGMPPKPAVPAAAAATTAPATSTATAEVDAPSWTGREFPALHASEAVRDTALPSLADRPCWSPLNQELDSESPCERRCLADDEEPVGDAALLSSNPPRDEKDEDLLYIVYTSGTTGVPKGVRGTRSGAVNRIRFGWKLSPFRDEDELVARRTPSSFVDFVAEMFCPLLAGVPIFLSPRGAHADPLRLVPALAAARATRITLTPSLLASLLRSEACRAGPVLPDLHTWLVSGEALHPDLALLFRQVAAPGAQLINLYGSTEVSGDATYCTLNETLQTREGRDNGISAAVEKFGGVLIGNPLPGVYISIVGPDLLPVSVGQPGELLVGGVGVALGYHCRPQENAKKFLRSEAHGSEREGKGVVHLPGLEPGRRVVRTGDRVVQLVAHGPLLWLGKLDGEVKVRGVRVSLEEVEMLACRAAGLPAGAFAVVYDPGGAAASGAGSGVSSAEGKATAVASIAPDRGRLLGFFESKEAQENCGKSAEFKRHLALELTAAQLPAVLTPIVGGFPLTRSGKVDKKALLDGYRKHSAKKLKGKAVSTAGDLAGSSSFSAKTSWSETSQTSAVRSLAAARRAVAQAVVAVLPDAQAAVMSWLTGLGENLQESSRFSSLTFNELGGTSLLAVEAAWRASSSAALAAIAPANVSAPTTSLVADDFLRGTLEEAASTLKNMLDSDPATTTRGGADGVATAVGGPHRKYGALPAGSVPPLPKGLTGTDSPSARASITSRKRRLQDVGRAHTRGGEPFLAIGRASAGPCPACALSGKVVDSAGGSGGAVVVARVQLRVRWSSCLRKCIDATPLVVVPKRVNGLAGRRPDRGHAGDMVDGSATRARTELTSLGSTVQGTCSSTSAAPASGVDLSCAGSTIGEMALGGAPRRSGGKAGQGTVYIGSHSGQFQSLDLVTGEREWSYTAGGRIESGAACSSAGSTVFFGCHDRHLYAIDRHTGSIVWSFETGDVIKCTPVCMPSDVARFDAGGGGAGDEKGSPAEEQGAVLVGSHDGVLRSLCQVVGTLLWSLDTGGALFASPAFDAGTGVVYAANTKGRVVAVDTSALSPSTGVKIAAHTTGALAEQILDGATGRTPVVLWEKQLPAPCFSSPAVCSARGDLALGCVDGGLYLLSSTGEQLWVCRRGEKPVFSSPCVLQPLCEGSGWDESERVGPHVIWGCHDGKVRCRSGLGLAWETNAGQGHPVFSSPCFGAVACEGCALPCPLVFACSVPGLITVLSLPTGQVVGEKRLPGDLFSSPVVVPGRRLLVVGCRDNRVYALDIVAVCSRCVLRAT